VQLVNLLALNELSYQNFFLRTFAFVNLSIIVLANACHSVVGSQSIALLANSIELETSCCRGICLINFSLEKLLSTTGTVAGRVLTTEKLITSDMLDDNPY